MQSSRNVLATFEVVATSQDPRLVDIADELGLPTTTTHRALSVLIDAGWVEPVPGPGKRWAVSERIRRVVGGAGTSLREVARPVLETLRDRCGESVSLVTLDGTSVVIVSYLDGVGVLRVVEAEGTRAPIHVAATGKAVLASLLPADRDALLPEPLRTYTPTTITDRVALDQELETVARQGWACMAGEWDEAVWSVGAAVHGSDGVPVGGIGVAWPASPLAPERVAELGEMVAEAARAVSARLGWLPGRTPAGERWAASVSGTAGRT